MDLDTKIKSTNSSSEQESLFTEEPVFIVKNARRKENDFHDDADDGETNEGSRSVRYFCLEYKICDFCNFRSSQMKYFFYPCPA